MLHGQWHQPAKGRQVLRDGLLWTRGERERVVTEGGVRDDRKSGSHQVEGATGTSVSVSVMMSTDTGRIDRH